MRRAIGQAIKALMAALCLSSAAQARDLSYYGTSGLIDMPDATMMDDGDLAVTVSNFGATTRYNLSFQLLPRLQATARYAIIRDFDLQFGPQFGGDRFDRSFDIQYLLLDERRYRPAVAIGLRDFAGTGVYSGEYIVATKTLAPKVRVTGGIGWGRLGSRGSFDNPLSTLFGSGYDTRDGDFGLGGDFQTDSWFRGPAAFFGGVEWQATDKLRFVAEYSSDAYDRETANGVFKAESPWNVGVNYQLDNGLNLGAAYLYGSELGVSLSYTINPKTPRAPGGQEPAPQSFLPRSTVAAQSWNLGPAGGRAQANATALQTRLDAEGIRLMGYQASGGVAQVRVENRRFDTTAQAAGRTARVLANTVDPQIERFDITFEDRGMAQTTVRLRRSDLAALEHDLEGAWHSLARAEIDDGFALGRGGNIGGLYPRYTWSVSPYAETSLFDPNEPIRFDAGVALAASYEPRPGLIFSGRVRQPVVGNTDDNVRASNSVLPRVRTDGPLYQLESDLEVRHLTAEYFFRPRPDWFGRVTFGYLEQNFGGLSAELLWYPLDSRLALGVEANYVVQRDFDQLFGFQDYDIVTGHASAYYDFGNGFRGQLDVGRYLAGDYGATVTLDREFNNGFSVGAFFTLTDVSAEEFGEGSFDKGLRFKIPVSWLTGQPSRSSVSRTLRPVTRDGGARLNVRNRLFDITKPYRGEQVVDGWGKFYR